MIKNATDEQISIIKDTEGYQRVIAVPGSGKTFCLVARIAFLIQNMFIDPSSIHAITFTNKAAREMTNRLKKIVGDGATCFTGTFHGKCNEILKEEIHRLSYPKSFSILDKNGQLDLIRTVAEEQGISLKDNNAKFYMDNISQKKQSMEYVSKYMVGPDKSQLINEIKKAANDKEKMYFNYLLKQRDNFALDFNDIIMFALYVLINFPDALEKWQDRCQYILCDEYQDVNHHQALLLELLSGKYYNLTVVGDDDQCIYGWRGSKVDYMVKFEQKYPKVKDYYLSQNFRSTPEIINVANSLIKSNQNRLTKEMHTTNPSGEKPIYYNAKTEKEEALWIANSILKARDEGRKYCDHSILVRASSQTRALEEAFVQNGITYKILSGAAFYGSEEIRTVLAYMRMVYSLNDLDFEWTIKRPRKGYGKKSLERLKEYAISNNMTLIEALGDQINKGFVKKKEVIDFYNNIMNFHNEYQNYSCKDIVNKVLDFGYREELQQDIDQKRLDNVTELLVTIADLESENGENIPLEELLAHFALFTNQDDDSDKNVVKVMTIHTAKGLEFGTVFVPGLVEGQFPSHRIKNQDELEEERRLFYVAITRAIKKLYLSSYNIKADCYFMRSSSFLDDIEDGLLNCINGSNITGGYYTPPMVAKTYFEVGDIVNHPIFGIGAIMNVDEGNQIYDIEFEMFPDTTRRIQFRANLTKE